MFPLHVHFHANQTHFLDKTSVQNLCRKKGKTHLRNDIFILTFACSADLSLIILFCHCLKEKCFKCNYRSHIRAQDSQASKHCLS